jgi:hypothetical protein
MAVFDEVSPQIKRADFLRAMREQNTRRAKQLERDEYLVCKCGEPMRLLVQSIMFLKPGLWYCDCGNYAIMELDQVKRREHARLLENFGSTGVDGYLVGEA